MPLLGRITPVALGRTKSSVFLPDLKDKMALSVQQQGTSRPTALALSVSFQLVIPPANRLCCLTIAYLVLWSYLQDKHIIFCYVLYNSLVFLSC